jgi:beta-1,2-mannobiose phosphorylase / 1,2-beta-oligomannan phosphorylase
MISVRKEGIIIQKSNLDFENEDVMNPAIIQEDEYVHVFYRAVSKDNFSSIGYLKLHGPLTIHERKAIPFIASEYEYESHGVEDPRIVKIEDTYYLTYTAYDGVNALGALATSKDLKNFEKKGIITPQVTFVEFNKTANKNEILNEKYERFNDRILLPNEVDESVLLWDKNLIFFPRKINNEFYFLHRIKPDIQIAHVKNIEDLTEKFWNDYLINFQNQILMTSKYEHEVSYIGGGCPPIETKNGWLIIYHGVRDTIEGYVYSACAAMLDLKNPNIEISRLPYPLFEPDQTWELHGEVINVCFPTGTAQFEDTLYIYYGAADESIACASLNLPELLNELKIYEK